MKKKPAHTRVGSQQPAAASVGDSPDAACVAFTPHTTHTTTAAGLHQYANSSGPSHPRKMRWGMGWWWLCAVCCLAVVVGMDPCDEQESAELWQQSVSRVVVICCARRFLKKRRERRLKFQPRAGYTRRARSKWGESSENSSSFCADMGIAVAVLQQTSLSFSLSPGLCFGCVCDVCTYVRWVRVFLFGRWSPNSVRRVRGTVG